MLEHIKEQIGQTKSQLGTLIHIGAGTGSELQEYLDLGFSQIALYEAVPELAKQLREMSSGLDQVAVYQTVIAEKAGKTDFHKMNNPRFSSIREQSELRDYYPNLHGTTVQLEAEGIKNAIEKLELSDDEINVLILEVQGAENELIKSLEAEMLQYFSWLIIRSSGRKRQIGEQDSEFKSALYEAEFISSMTVDDISPFFLNFFRRDDSAIRLRKVCEEFEAIKVKLESNKSIVSKMKLELEINREQFQIDSSKNVAQIDQLKDQVKVKSKKIQELQEELDKVKNEKQEILDRQEMLDEEVTKAEAQLELIKDVVIREKAF